MQRFILASRSPRRAELLAAAGFVFDVVPADIDETRWPGEPPDRYVVRMAREKALAVRRAAARAGAEPVLAADTAVVVDGRVLGKPGDAGEAAEMLRALSGRTHEVMTGLALAGSDGRLTAECVVSRVTFATLSEPEVEWYVTTGEPMDKAGAYAVQGLASRFIERVEGSYTNVVGLPIASVYRMLRTFAAGPAAPSSEPCASGFWSE